MSQSILGCIHLFPCQLSSPDVIKKSGLERYVLNRRANLSSSRTFSILLLLNLYSRLYIHSDQLRYASTSRFSDDNFVHRGLGFSREATIHECWARWGTFLEQNSLTSLSTFKSSYFVPECFLAFDGVCKQSSIWENSSRQIFLHALKRVLRTTSARWSNHLLPFIPLRLDLGISGWHGFVTVTKEVAFGEDSLKSSLSSVVLAASHLAKLI